MGSDALKLLVCGGGNGAHTLCGLASYLDKIDCRVLTLFADEAERWKAALVNEYMTVNRKSLNGTDTSLKSKPSCITKDPKDVVGDSDIIIFTVPSFAHMGYLEAIAPFIKPGTTLIGLPGYPGFEFQCYHVFKDRMEDLVIVNFETLPWACRLEIFGKEVSIHGTKGQIGCSVIRHNLAKSDPISAMQEVFGDQPVIRKFNSFISPTLNCRFHSPILYGAWGKWDGKPVDRVPLIYKEMSDASVDMLSKVGDELVQIGKAISTAKPQIDTNDVAHYREWLRDTYKEYITDFSDMQKMFWTNSATEKITQPMVEVGENKFAPDFKNRYYVEDTPFKMVVLRGIAACAGVATPYTDEVLYWSQKVIGKEYLVDGQLTGKDMKDTRAPQVFGINTLDEIVRING